MLDSEAHIAAVDEAEAAAAAAKARAEAEAAAEQAAAEALAKQREHEALERALAEKPPLEALAERYALQQAAQAATKAMETALKKQQALALTYDEACNEALIEHGFGGGQEQNGNDGDDGDDAGDGDEDESALALVEGGENLSPEERAVLKAAKKEEWFAKENARRAEAGEPALSMEEWEALEAEKRKEKKKVTIDLLVSLSGI